MTTAVYEAPSKSKASYIAQTSQMSLRPGDAAIFLGEYGLHHHYHAEWEGQVYGIYDEPEHWRPDRGTRRGEMPFHDYLRMAVDLFERERAAGNLRWYSWWQKARHRYTNAVQAA